MREMASVLQVLDRGGLFLHEARRATVFSRWKLQGMKAVKPPVSSCRLAHDLEVVHALLDGLAAAEHHGRGGPHAELVRGAMDVDPVLGLCTSGG